MGWYGLSTYQVYHIVVRCIWIYGTKWADVIYQHTDHADVELSNTQWCGIREQILEQFVAIFQIEKYTVKPEADGKPNAINLWIWIVRFTRADVGHFHYISCGRLWSQLHSSPGVCGWHHVPLWRGHHEWLVISVQTFDVSLWVYSCVDLFWRYLVWRTPNQTHPPATTASGMGPSTRTYPSMGNLWANICRPLRPPNTSIWGFWGGCQFWPMARIRNVCHQSTPKNQLKAMSIP